MPSQRSHLLCITLTPRSADLAEVRRGGAGVQVLRRSSFVFPKGIGLDQPAELGAALSTHLEQAGFTQEHAVIGLCPHWVLTRHKQVPPADADTMRGIVNLQIEREFAGSAADMTFDYLLGQAASDQTQAPLLLVGVQTKVLRQVEQLATTAGLKIDAITPTTLAACNSRTGNIALIERDIAGLIEVANGQANGLVACHANADHLNDHAARNALITDLSRSILQLPGTQANSHLTIILPESVARDDAKALQEIATPRFGEVEVVLSDPAVLLGEHVTAPAAAIIDFKASRLRPPKQSRLSPAMQWGIRVAVVLVLIIGVAGYLWLDATSRRDDLRAEYDAIKEKAEHLEAVLADNNLAADWYDKRPPALDCMLELTRTFPSRGEIRVETLTLRADMTGQIDCAAEDRETMDDYFIKMQQSSALLEINRGSVRPVGGNSNWINFPIAFRFDPTAEGGRP